MKNNINIINPPIVNNIIKPKNHRTEIFNFNFDKQLIIKKNLIPVKEQQ